MLESSPERLQEVDARFGARMKARRTALDLSQHALAAEMTERYGVQWHQTTVAKVEAGSRSASLREALTVSAVLFVPLEVLIADQSGEAEHTTQIRAAVNELSRLEASIRERITRLLESDTMTTPLWEAPWRGLGPGAAGEEGTDGEHRPQA